ncbi:DUF4998 domain-containing protein [Sphingobacterium griseoflavum]|uniref:F5/8 type C domain-containing protein n=1 Tax=Sphingobacterium griseoflavum TaxID=1474952 RepID=A0ABQ3HYW8_9SPHI|nr:DUF4998 domain-containing protein [Sphingobacterium griseoflavum]GHE33860.1 hypothetical protein GCM10017764_16400 [Sphingobacterium griseoflavum]
MIKNVLNSHFSYFIFGIILLCRCTPIDYYYSDYLENAERVYPGRVDSISFKPGYNRAAIQSLISTDARVVKMRISWGANGIFETPILAEDIATYKDILIPTIEEGIYTFDIRTYDSEGNQSMRAEVFGRVYGPNYSANLNNRIIEQIRKENQDLIVNWIPESGDSTLRGIEISYLTLTGDSATVFSEAAIHQTRLPNYKPDTRINYRTLFKPTSLAIDMFYAPTQNIDPVSYLPTERSLHPRTNWAIAGFSSEEPANNRLANRVIDDDVATFWITRYSTQPTDYPNHWITIDMKEELQVDGFFFAQKNGDRKVRELEIFISQDNETFESVGRYGLAAIDRTYQYIDLPARKSLRYFKVVPLSGHDSQRQPGLAEIGTYTIGN